MKFDRVSVIHRQFFACPYLPAAEEKQAIANTPPEQIRIARVVDKLSAASTRAAVQKPLRIHISDVNVFGGLYVPDLLITEALAGVFDNASASRDVLKRKHSIPMKGRTPYSKIKIRLLRVNPVRLRNPRFHFTSQAPTDGREPLAAHLPFFLARYIVRSPSRTFFGLGAEIESVKSKTRRSWNPARPRSRTISW